MKATITCPISYNMNGGNTLFRTEKRDEIIKNLRLMKRFFLELDDEPLGKNKEFLKGIYGLEMPKAIRKFDKLDCRISSSRDDDKKMTLEKYLKKMDDSTYLSIALSAGWQNDPKIIFSVKLTDNEDLRIGRFAWYKCPLNKPNYKEVSTLFEKVYSRD